MSAAARTAPARRRGRDLPALGQRAAAWRCGRRLPALGWKAPASRRGRGLAALSRTAPARRCAVFFCLLLAGWLAVSGVAAAQGPPDAQGLRFDAPDSTMAGVSNPQRAWQNWTLNCQGCHRPDGSGSAGTAPSLAGTVSQFLGVPGGREYLGRVPGVATSPLGNADLAELLNWMFRRFDPQHLPADFQPFTAQEIGLLRTRPLRLEASQMRSDLLQRAEQSTGSP